MSPDKEAESWEFVVVKSLSPVGLFATLWTAAHQAPLPFTISWCLLRFMCIELVILSISSSAIPISSCPQSFPAWGSFPVSRLFISVGQSIGALASAVVLPMNIQGWFPLVLTGLISLLSKGLLQVIFEYLYQNIIIYLHTHNFISPWYFKKWGRERKTVSDSRTSNDSH